jgi:hypothetical protein
MSSAAVSSLTTPQKVSSMENILPTIIRYFVVIILYIFVFGNKNTAMMFIEYIVLFILNFFTLAFLFKDMYSVDKIVANVFDKRGGTDLGTPIYTKMFVFVIFITLLLNIATFGIIFAVLSYGRNSIKDDKNYVMNPDNIDLLLRIKECFFYYVPIVSIFSLFFIYSHITDTAIKSIIENMVGIICSVFLLASSIYACVLSVKFLENKTYNRTIYMPKSVS